MRLRRQQLYYVHTIVWQNAVFVYVTIVECDVDGSTHHHFTKSHTVPKVHRALKMHVKCTHRVSVGVTRATATDLKSRQLLLNKIGFCPNERVRICSSPNRCGENRCFCDRFKRRKPHQPNLCDSIEHNLLTSNQCSERFFSSLN